MLLEVPPVVYLNVPSDEMKSITQEILEDGMPVWMGCDVGKQMDRKRGSGMLIFSRLTSFMVWIMV